MIVWFTSLKKTRTIKENFKKYYLNHLSYSAGKLDEEKDDDEEENKKSE